MFSGKVGVVSTIGYEFKPSSGRVVKTESKRRILLIIKILLFLECKSYCPDYNH